MIRDMIEMTLLGVISDRPSIVGVLHDLGVVHIHEEPSESVSQDNSSELKILRGKTLGLLEALEWDDWNQVSKGNLEEKRRALDPVSPPVLESIGESLDSFSGRLNELRARRAALEGRAKSIRASLRTISHFDTFIRESHSKGNEVSLWWIQRAAPSEIASRLQKKIREKEPLKLEENVLYHSAITTGGERVLALATNPDHIGEVNHILSENGCLPWLMPEEFESMNIQEALPLMDIELKDIPRRLSEIDENIGKTRSIWGPKIGALYILLDEKLDQVLTEEGCHTSGEMFRIGGWVPLDEKNRLAFSLKERFKDRILLKWREPGPSDWAAVPTSIRNPSYFKPFELFLKLMPVMNYRGLDPTVLIGVFFPFFSGCMIGDVGYGFMVFLIGLKLKVSDNRPLLRDVGLILVFTAAWSFFWGLAYGEFFGDLGHRLFHMEPLWVERSQVVLPVMVFTVSLGFVHILLGFLMGVFQGIKSGNRHLWVERLGNIFILAALVVSLTVIKGWLPRQLFSLTVSLLVIGLALLLSGGGIGGLVESLGSIGNILSYVRIAAIGLSSAILAMVATSFVDSLGLSVVGVFMALTIHLLNFVLAIAGSGLHSARLQYVEFLGKFHSGGGTPYKPFSRRSPEIWRKQ